MNTKHIYNPRFTCFHMDTNRIFYTKHQIQRVQYDFKVYTMCFHVLCTYLLKEQTHILYLGKRSTKKNKSMTANLVNRISNSKQGQE